MELTTVATALGIVEKVSKGLNWVRDRARASKDADLKESISDLYNDFLDLRSVIVRLTEENAELQRQLDAEKEKPESRQVGEANYYFVGEEGPYCQPCYDDKGKLIRFTPQHHHAGGTRRQCRVCRNVFIEVPEAPQPSVRRKPYGWMI